MTTTPALSRSAKLFQERRTPDGRVTRRTPTPRSNLGSNLVHQLPLKPPNPITDTLQLEGDHPPDAGPTKPWPYGEEEIV